MERLLLCRLCVNVIEGTLTHYVIHLLFKQYLVYDFLSLFQLLAGISKPTSGSIYIQKYGNDGNPVQSPKPLSSGRVGIVFQFPERY